MKKEKKKKAVFLDRDGTIVAHKPFLSSPDELELLTNAAEGLRLFKKYGYMAILVTNQSGIARGFFNEGQLALVHKKLLNMLEDEGITIDDVYYCPHHIEGVIEKYKIVCECRKPKTGMFQSAARRHSIDLSRSIMIGDSEVDMMAGKNAGCKSILIKNTHSDEILRNLVVNVDYIVNDLLEAARLFTY